MEPPKSGLSNPNTPDVKNQENQATSYIEKSNNTYEDLCGGLDDEAPLVDVALAGIKEQDALIYSSPAPDEELAAIRGEMTRLHESVTEVLAASARVAVAKKQAAMDNAMNFLKTHPLKTLALGLLAGFVLGSRK